MAQRVFARSLLAGASAASLAALGATATATSSPTIRTCRADSAEKPPSFQSFLSDVRSAIKHVSSPNADIFEQRFNTLHATGAVDAYQKFVARACDIVEQECVEKGVPGLSVAVIRNGHLIYSGAYGLSDVENKVAFSVETKCRIASISKSITALAVATLIDQGTLDLDTPIGTYFAEAEEREKLANCKKDSDMSNGDSKSERKSACPSLPEDKAHLTLRQLLSHRAGVRHYKGDEFKTMKACTSAKDALSIFIDDPLVDAVDCAKGSHLSRCYEFKYSTYGTVLLSAVIEAVTGEPFSDYVSQHVLKPLHLHDTCAESPTRLQPGRCRYYTRSKSRLQNAPYVDVSCKLAGGGFTSTAEDIAKLGDFILNTVTSQNESPKSETRPTFTPRTIPKLSPSILQEFVAPVVLSQDDVERLRKADDKLDTREYGLGFELKKDPRFPDETLFGHSGGAMGASSWFLVLPKQRVVVAMLCNGGEVSLIEACLKLAALVVDTANAPYGTN